MSLSSLPDVTHSAGKASVATILSLVAVLGLAMLFDFEHGGRTQDAMATSTATTTVTVLNTPPSWTVSARERFPSSTSTPTNTGTSTVWEAIGTDSNGESYYFIVCKASSTPTAFASAPPVCGGGTTNIWGVSSLTVSGQLATVSTTTQDAWAEKNDWYGYICDANAGNPRCNAVMYNGLHEAGPASATSSPFMVNHRPTFTAFADDSPTLPGAVVTWTTTASDPDSVGGADTVKLYVCRANDFVVATAQCGAGGYWASSTFVVSNPSTSTTITIPTQDKNYAAYGFVVDEHLHAATGGQQGVDSVLTVANAAPYVASSTITVYDRFGSTTIDTTLLLNVQEGLSQNFVMRFDVSDDNSCQADGGGNEIADADINVFRSGVGGAYGAGCDSTSEFNANNCYTHTATTSWWTPVCYQVPGATCTSSTLSVTWECTFPLWYIADPTDAGSQFPGEDWRGSARATDDDASLGTYSTDDEAADGASQLIQFLSFRATGSPIAYGSWEPGQNTPTLSATTTVYATGNTGLDEYLSGDAMCTTYPATCSGNATSTIYVPFQEYSITPSTNYGSGTDLSTSTVQTVEVEINIAKTTATSSAANKDTYWGIQVPGSITFAGDYVGRNYIDAVVGESVAW